MKDQIRAEFEQEFPLPNGVTFDGDHYVADPAVMGAFQNATIWGHIFRGWKACAQPARQVGGDEQDLFESKFPMPAHCTRFPGGYSSTAYGAWDAHKHCDRWEGWKARAALAPAAVVMPEKPKRYTADVFLHNNFSTVQTQVIRASDFDEFVARLNRNAIPVELLKSLCNAWQQSDEIGLEKRMDELRALLGKDD